MTSDAADGPETEQLDEEALDALLADQDAALGSSLRALLEPPEDIGQRTTQVVNRALQGRSALSIGMDLFGLGFWTLRTILSDDPAPADGVREGHRDED